MKLIYSLLLVHCFSFTTSAQLPIKNSALTGEWKLISLNGEHDTYTYDCEKKEFHMSNQMFFSFNAANIPDQKKHGKNKRRNSKDRSCLTGKPGQVRPQVLKPIASI